MRLGVLLGFCNFFFNYGSWIQSRDVFYLCSWYHHSVQEKEQGKGMVTFWNPNAWHYDLHFFCLLPNNLLLPRTLRPTPCKPCHYSGAVPWQRWRPCTQHACWSSNWNGSGIIILGLLDYPFLIFVVPKTFVCNNILAMLFTVQLLKCNSYFSVATS